ncbi:MAG: NADH-quinone oxidoreductase subunit NuoG [Anaerolineales bacterium]|nr:NADH-quinone oxidoreductase subunit NuoG [Anaerolineales bacterium]
MTKQVTLTIDGQQVAVSEGTLIVNAAKQIGIDIPVFCYHPKMEPVGMCRQCLVEVGRPVVDRATGQVVMEDGKPKIQFGAKLETACTTPVSDGMVVLTASEKAKANQREILEFLLTSHPLDCPVCDKGGECPLQNLTLAHGAPASRFIYDEKQHADKRVPLGDLIWLDRERCIQCARCIRFQDEIAGESVLAFYQRGRATDIITNSEPGFDSIFSGNTTDICPVGALTTADFRFGARPWEMKAAASICSQCPVGCNVTLNTRREAKSGGKVVLKRVMPRQNEAVNEIWICDKGRFAHHFTENEHRLATPLARKDGKLALVSWDKALGLVAGKLADAKGEAVVLASGRLSNEDLFNLKQLADGLGGEALLYTQMGGGELTTAYGVPAGTNFAEMGIGTTILVVASDLYNEAPIWYLRLKQAAERGATLILANARETKLEKYSQFVVRYSYGDEAETICGLAKKAHVGEAITSAENLVVLYGSDGLGLDGSSALAAACAELVKSRAGKPNNGLIGVWPRANDQGAWELGFKPVADLKAVFQKANVVYIAGADPFGDNPELTSRIPHHASRIPQHASRSTHPAPFIIVQELFLTETAKLADVILPAQAVTEREGSFTSGERRAQRFYPAVPARGQSRADFVITAQIAAEFGLELEGRFAARVMDKMAATVKTFAGISYRELAETTEQWPIVGRGDLYYGGTTYENKQGLGVILALSPSPTGRGARGEGKPLRPDEDHWLAVPVTRLYDLGITVATSALLKARTGGAHILLHPDSAQKLGLAAGEQVELNGNRLEVRLDPTVPVMVALVPRSMGVPIAGPMVAKIKAA